MRITALLIAIALFVTAVRADAGGSEIQVSRQPEKLIIQSGLQRVGVQFDPKTNTGMYPAPVIIDQNGVLHMDLGGSKTYSLSCIGSAITVPWPDKSVLISSSTPPPPSPLPPAVNSQESGRTQNQKNVSPGLLIAVTLGLIAVVITLSELSAHRKKKTFSSDGYEDNE